MNLRKFVRRITVVERKPDERCTVVFQGKRRQAESSRGTAAGRLVCGLMEGQSEFAREYTRLHKASNKKQKDGWIKDASLNLLKAKRKAFSRVRSALR